MANQCNTSNVISRTCWYQIIDNIQDAKSIFMLSKVNRFFHRILQEQRENIYKVYCYKARIYKRLNETWEAAFLDLPNRIIHEGKEYTSRLKVKGFTTYQKFHVIFGNEYMSRYIGLVYSDRVVVTSLDIEDKMHYVINIDFSPGFLDEVALINSGETLTVYNHNESSYIMHDVKSGLSSRKITFAGTTSCLSGTVFHRQSLFHGVDQVPHSFREDFDYLEHVFYSNDRNHSFTMKNENACRIFNSRNRKFTDVTVANGSFSVRSLKYSNSLLVKHYDKNEAFLYNIPSRSLEYDFDEESFSSVVINDFIIAKTTYSNKYETQCFELFDTANNTWNEQYVNFKDVPGSIFGYSFYSNSPNVMYFRNKEGYLDWLFVTYYNGQFNYRVFANQAEIAISARLLALDQSLFLYKNGDKDATSQMLNEMNDWLNI
ncbi:unnamed protein product [Bursaphelenchus okinawaensis]|uniref:Uncharacterized protein n=1 Tax=Bursaphelenchus okinawaensis TaxID=465554 RepID=A0A811KS91_9BILA|nr:unnamed protein product [Bursaphelenchus okinawaensis]CAG9111207.1 unnamed protein product [Bursaphelenchus okinawaensis]